MTSPTPDDAPIQDRLAKALGAQYEVRSLLGRGGFAEVYEVWDKSLDRRLAVKVLRPDIAWTPGMLSRFKQEAKAVAQLGHPNILPIHFVGEAEGLVYYAMPYIEGQSLGDLIRTEGRLDPDRALGIGRSIFDALEHAHQKNLVHRDIKPENIMIEKASGRPLLVDFGIAKQMEEGGKTGKGLTQTGFVVGTPHYMSPEQALGQGGVDARSDIYAMGAVLFQMVTGAPPFDGETSQEIVAQHITAPPPLASSVEGKVPRWLSDVIVRCLAKRPADRFNTASHAARALTAGRMSGPQDSVSLKSVAKVVDQDRTAVIPTAERTAARPSTPAAPSAPPATRSSRTGAIVAAVVVLAVIAGGAWYFMRPVLVVTNHLLEPIQLSIPGQQPRTVDAEAETSISLGGTPGPVMWVLVRPTTPSGAAMGVEMGGSISTEGVRGTVRREIDGRTSEQPAFAPLITNAGTQPLDITVNPGLAGALNCGCRIPPGANRMRIGYYSLYQNSGVQARTPNGRTTGFGDLGKDVDPLTASVGLRFEDKDFRE